VHPDDETAGAHLPTSEKGPAVMPDAAPLTGMNRRGVAMMSASHVVDDIYQGCIPALLPFLVAERHYTYAAVSGLTLAATVLSSVAQPVFGWWTDRAPRRWMVAAGIGTAATGVALAGVFHSYVVTWLVIAVSGLGVAAFHPEAARAARQAAGDSNRGMSVFALGGNVGFAFGTLVATPVLLLVGLRGTVLLALPGAAMVVLLLARLSRTLDGPVGAPRRHSLPRGDDVWPAFRRLTAVVVARSILFFGLTSFLALYFIHERGASTAAGGAALTTFLAGGAVGTLLGGWVADRYGRLATIRWGLAVIPPALVGMLLAPTLAVAFPLVAVVGVTTFMPFSVFVVLGQDYLPNRIGTASGVTVGLAVSVGGLFTPVLGWVADATSLHTTLWLLVALPVLALALSARLRAPARTGTASAGEDVAAGRR
jgi:FSR family fosmidomycin resistance protein-like MFS transporter